MRILVTADPASAIQVKYDTTLRLMEELLARGHQIDFCDLTQMDPNSPDYLQKLLVKPVLLSDPSREDFLKLGDSKTTTAEDYKVFLNRKDPPVDDFFIAHAKRLAEAPSSIVQINNPAVIWKYSEHVLPTRYPRFSTPTFVCESAESLKAAIRSQPGESVLKPDNQCSGFGIEFFKKEAPDSEIQSYYKKWGPQVIVQPYLEEITKSGDLRILVMNKKVIGSVLRVPKQGSRLANLHQGATGRAFTPTAKQLEAVKVVADDLTREGIYLIGFDFIGEYLNEVNITSPSAMVQINEVMNKKAQVEIVDEILALAEAKEKT